MNTRQSIRRLLTAGLALLWLPFPAWAIVYYAASIEGWIVDAETGTPIEGVIIVAHWQLRGGFEGGVPIRELQILESVSDEKGRYFFAAWGPKLAWSGRLKSASPELLFFKPGYKYLALDNDPHRNLDTSKSDWDGKTVKMERFRGTLEEYARHLSFLNSTLWGVAHGHEPCGWKSFPRLLGAIEFQYEKLRKSGTNYSSVVSRLQANDSHLKAAGCGSIEEVIQR